MEAEKQPEQREKPYDPQSGYIFPKASASRVPSLGKSLSRAGVIGLHPIAGLLVGGTAGYFLWKKFGAHWIFWALLALGFVAGCRNAYRDIRIMLREEETENAAKNPPRH